jgi:hypothetical protein
MDGPARTRRGLDISDDDEESDGEDAHREPGGVYRYGDGDEDRAMAVLRGAISVSKRVPSKAAIASLQVVKVEDLKEADKSEFYSFYPQMSLSAFMLRFR